MDWYWDLLLHHGVGGLAIGGLLAALVLLVVLTVLVGLQKIGRAFGEGVRQGSRRAHREG